MNQIYFRPATSVPEKTIRSGPRSFRIFVIHSTRDPSRVLERGAFYSLPLTFLAANRDASSMPRATQSHPAAKRSKNRHLQFGRSRRCRRRPSHGYLRRLSAFVRDTCDFLCLIRPDDHIGLFQRPANERSLREYLGRVA